MDMLSSTQMSSSSVNSATSKRNIIVISVGIVALLLICAGVWSLFFSGPSSEEIEERVAEFNRQQTTFSNPPTTTGAQLSGDTPETQTINKLFELRQQLPLETETFTLDYDYATLRYMVTLKGDETINVFWQWVDESEYTALSDADVFFTTQQL